MLVKLVAVWIAVNILIVTTICALEAVGAVRIRLARRGTTDPALPQGFTSMATPPPVVDAASSSQ